MFQPKLGILMCNLKHMYIYFIFEIRFYLCLVKRNRNAAFGVLSSYSCRDWPVYMDKQTDKAY